MYLTMFYFQHLLSIPRKAALSAFLETFQNQPSIQKFNESLSSGAF